MIASSTNWSVYAAVSNAHPRPSYLTHPFHRLERAPRDHHKQITLTIHLNDFHDIFAIPRLTFTIFRHPTNGHLHCSFIPHPRTAELHKLSRSVSVLSVCIANHCVIHLFCPRRRSLPPTYVYELRQDPLTSALPHPHTALPEWHRSYSYLSPHRPMAAANTNAVSFQRVEDAIMRRIHYRDHGEELEEDSSRAAIEHTSPEHFQLDGFTNLPVELVVYILKLLPGLEIARFQRVTPISLYIIANHGVPDIMFPKVSKLHEDSSQGRSICSTQSNGTSLVP